ncbi:formylglycine-generating enzyme family protein [Streptomyces sp. NPDC058195]|uniref:formylglycine-generating enzyme family protein n=1 Tax=Streptomyces sp. NPDC058195 TaxID=3346375 RepID=UPI0036F01D33
MNPSTPLAEGEAAAWALLQSTTPTATTVDDLRTAVSTLARAVAEGRFPADDLWAVGAMHPHAAARLAVLQVAAEQPKDEEAAALLAWAVNDADDRVSVAALDAIREHGALSTIDEVFVAAGRSAAAFDGATSAPGDIRRNAGVTALSSLIGRHDDPAAERGRLVMSSGSRRPDLRSVGFDTTGMIEIPADSTPGSRAFCIDAHPVTWADYARFVDAVREHGPLWSHPGQDAQHDHDVLRHVSHDQREELMRHPVTHVSWFDAWAYATWSGKRLPSAAQWERAAGLLAGHSRPWGEEAPTPAHARCWEPDRGDVTRAYVSGDLTELTSRVGAHPRGASEAGVMDLLGNVWEWTRTRYLDGHEITPFVGAASYTDSTGNWTLTACVKGGSWATPPDELSSATRVAKHVLQHGPETGFRCVIEPNGE